MKKQQKPKQSNPRFYAFAAVSIDGRISLDSKTMPNWLSAEDWKFFQKQMKSMDVAVAGSATYRAAKVYMDKRNSYVFTSTVTKPKKQGSVTFLNPKYTDIRTLFSAYKKVGVVGGAAVYKTMFDAGLLDELYLTIEPVIFGYGKELVKKLKIPARLLLKSVSKLNARGTIVLHYEVIH